MDVRKYLFVAAIAACWSGQAPAQSAQTLADASRKAKQVITVTPIYSQVLIHRIPPGWIPAFEESNALGYSKGYVPAGQTKEDWKEMISVQGYKGVANNPNVAPRKWLIGMAGQLMQVCGAENAVVTPLGEKQIAGRPGYAVVLGCPQPTSLQVGVKPGQGEIAYIAAFQGKDDLYLIQRAIRTDAPYDRASPPITADNAEALMKDVEPIALCDPGKVEAERCTP